MERKGRSKKPQPAGRQGDAGNLFGRRKETGTPRG